MYQTSPTRRSWGNLTHLLQLLAHLIRLRHQRHQLDVIVERRQDAGVCSALPAARSTFPKRCARGQREGVNRLPPDLWVALGGCSSTAKIRFNASGPCRSPALSWVGGTQPALIPWERAAQEEQQQKHMLCSQQPTSPFFQNWTDKLIGLESGCQAGSFCPV